MSHVALLLPDLEAGGAQRVMLFLAREFSARGHHVDLVLLQTTGALLEMIPKGVRVVELGARNYGLGQLGLALSSIFRLMFWLRRTRSTVLLSTITGANIVALVARKMANSPPRVVIREAVTLKNTAMTPRILIMRWLYPQADAVIALSPVMVSELVEQVGVAANRVYCIANPVDSEFIREQACMYLQHPWLDDDHLRIVISVGRLIPQKGYATLLYAFALLPEELSVRLIIVGEGPERATLERLAEDLGVRNRVELIGFDANPWRWMARADLFVLPSLWEGHPNVLLEAMTLGLPVVVSEYDASVHDLFIDVPEYPQRVVASGMTDQMSEAMREMLENSVIHAPPNYKKPGASSVDAYENILFYKHKDV